MTMLSKNFSRSEFACKCGCGYDTVDAQLLDILQNLRNALGPLTITSGCRCRAHNAAVGGSDDSQHLYGRAADIVVSDVDPETVAQYIESMSVPVGLGRYAGWVHVDTRGTAARWGG